MVSHQSSAGAIRLHRVSNNEKRKRELPIATTFSAFQTSSISTRADSLRRARLREFIELRLAASSRRSDWSLLSGFHCLPVRRSNHICTDSKSAGTTPWQLEVE